MDLSCKSHPWFTAVTFSVFWLHTSFHFMLMSVFSIPAHITGLISEQLLRAAVGGSILILCSLPGNPLTFYWKEDQSPYLLCHWDSGKTLPECDKYKGRFQVFNSEFSSGNISIRLDNISPEDDQKTFFAFVHFYDEQKKVTKPPERWCRSTLQVSAPYQHLVLTVNHTTNTTTCSARGGYPAAQVSWKGLNRSSDEQQDLQDAETFLQQDPTEKTFSFTSSVNVTGLKSVTCIVYDPHSYESITETKKIPDPQNPTSSVSTPEEGSSAAVIVGSVLGILFLIAILAGAVLFYLRYRSQHQPQAQDPDPPNQPLVVLNSQNGTQEEATAQAQDTANQPPVQLNPQDGAQAEATDPSEDTVLLSEDRAEFFCQTRTSEGTADRDTCEDAAASPEKEILLEKENGNEDDASD